MSFPQVSVIVAVYNCRDTVERALRSALDQTIDAERVEVIAVDDGSTDGSGELLDELAGREPRLKVAHQPNSGGPGAPRNAGIDLAAGEFVYFLDSDDYLGPEALERMCAMADENGTDIVVGKYVGVRRTVPRWMFRRNFPRVTVADKDPGVYGSLSALKMFRRSMVERHKIRFAEGDLSGEDQIFTAHAFLHADGISVVGDYGCYYLVAREDRTSAVQRGGAPTKDYFARVAEVLEMIDRHLEPGELRDRLLFRHFNLEILGWRLGPRYIREDEPRRAEAYAAGRELVAGWMTPGVLERLEQRHRFTVHCLRHDLRGPMEEFMRFYHARHTPELVVEGDRAFAAYPGFRDPAAGIPDELYEVTDEPPLDRVLTGLEWVHGRLVISGTGHLRGADERQERRCLVLRHRGSGEEIRLPAGDCRDDRPGGGSGDNSAGGGADFRVEIDPTTAAAGRPLAHGSWDVSVGVRVAGFEAVARFGERKAAGVEPLEPLEPALTADGRTIVRPQFTGWVGNLTLQVGSSAALSGPVLRVVEVAWSPRSRRPLLRVRCEVTAVLAGEPDNSFEVELRRRGTEDVRHADAALDGRPDRPVLTAEFDLGGCRPGRWDISGEIRVGETTIHERLEPPGDPAALPGPAAAAPLSLRRATPYRTAKGKLSVHITERRAVRRLRRAVGRS